jgi:hypothetical protein
MPIGRVRLEAVLRDEGPTVGFLALSGRSVSRDLVRAFVVLFDMAGESGRTFRPRVIYDSLHALKVAGLP